MVTLNSQMRYFLHPIYDIIPDNKSHVKNSNKRTSYQDIEHQVQNSSFRIKCNIESEYKSRLRCEVYIIHTGLKF